METQHLPQQEITGDIYWDKMTQKINIKSHQKWIDEIKKYRKGEYTDDEIIKFALSYTLQSLRNNEDMDRFKWKSLYES